MESDSAQQDLLLQQDAGLVQVTMNRPKALNALSHDMIKKFSEVLLQWQADETVKTVLVTGAGERAFCAGGDIKSAYEKGIAYKEGVVPFEDVSAFFKDEYRLNRSLYHADVPIIALMNGIVMGGGYGIAGPCSYRICSENTVFAMPETGIGFFPDIGGVYYLAQTPGHIGAYLAISGDKITGADMLYCGLATHYVPITGQRKLLTALTGFDGGATGLEEILGRCAEEPADESVLKEKQALINRCFGFETVEDILDALAKEDDAWAHQKRELLLSRSPTSLRVALKHYRMAVTESFDTVIARDFVLAQNFLKADDFYEGVRCALIDKGAIPSWSPSTLDKSCVRDVELYFLNQEQALDEEVLA